MRLGIAAGPVLLLLWQAAPIDTVRDPTGRVKLSVGFGAGQFENRVYSCDGNLVSANRLPYTSVGAQLDAWPTSHFRVTGFGGRLSSNSSEFDGGFGGLMGAIETRHLGVGAGVATIPNDGGGGVPVLYLRFGDNDKAHVRTDLFGPEPAFGTTGILRIGIASKQGLIRGRSWFAGLSVPIDADEGHASGVFGELSFPVGHQLDLTTSGAFRSFDHIPDWGLALGLRYHLGR